MWPLIKSTDIVSKSQYSQENFTFSQCIFDLWTFNPSVVEYSLSHWLHLCLFTCPNRVHASESCILHPDCLHWNLLCALLRWNLRFLIVSNIVPHCLQFTPMCNWFVQQFRILKLQESSRQLFESLRVFSLLSIFWVPEIYPTLSCSFELWRRNCCELLHEKSQFEHCNVFSEWRLFVCLVKYLF